MQKIKLTNESGVTIRIIPHHIVAYGPADDASDLILSVQSADRCIKVKESAEEIDKLLADLP